MLSHDAFPVPPSSAGAMPPGPGPPAACSTCPGQGGGVGGGGGGGGGSGKLPTAVAVGLWRPPFPPPYSRHPQHRCAVAAWWDGDRSNPDWNGGGRAGGRGKRDRGGRLLTATRDRSCSTGGSCDGACGKVGSIGSTLASAGNRQQLPAALVSHPAPASSHCRQLSGNRPPRATPRKSRARATQHRHRALQVAPRGQQTAARNRCVLC